MLPPLFMIAAVQPNADDCSGSVVLLKTGELITVGLSVDEVISMVHNCTSGYNLIQCRLDFAANAANQQNTAVNVEGMGGKRHSINNMRFRQI